MRELGYVYGEHFVTEARGADGRSERFPALAAELVGLQLDVIVAAGNALPALKQATSTVPIVMAAVNDPVLSGYVKSLARPGGNITGLSFGGVELHRQATRVAQGAGSRVRRRWPCCGIGAHHGTGRRPRPPRGRAGGNCCRSRFEDTGEIEEAFKAATVARAGALFVFAPAALFVHRQRVVELAARYRLPAIYELRSFVEAGGLMSYAADIDDIWRRAAAYVDKILKGDKPGDLPVELPTKFELVINLKAAKALGITIPQALLLRADEVIQ